MRRSSWETKLSDHWRIKKLQIRENIFKETCFFHDRKSNSLLGFLVLFLCQNVFIRVMFQIDTRMFRWTSCRMFTNTKTPTLTLTQNPSNVHKFKNPFKLKLREFEETSKIKKPSRNFQRNLWRNFHCSITLSNSWCHVAFLLFDCSRILKICANSHCLKLRGS